MLNPIEWLRIIIRITKLRATAEGFGELKMNEIRNVRIVLLEAAADDLCLYLVTHDLRYLDKDKCLAQKDPGLVS